MTRKAPLFSILPILLAAFAIFFLRFYWGFMYSDEEKWRRVFDSTVKRVRDNYVEPVEAEELTYDALRGVCRSLDPFSDFFSPEDYQRFEEDVKGVYGGVGIYITQDDDGVIRVVSPIFGGPAFRAGVRPGDIITAVEGESIEGRSTGEITLLIKGHPGTEVTITMVRPGEREKDITLVREKIHIESVQSARMLDDSDGTAYVLLADFQETSPWLLRERLTELEKAGMKRLVLDLRNNGGGTLSAAQEIADLFLSSGDMVIIKYRSGADVHEKARAGEAFEHLPMAVLINGASASASEILAAALQDNNRAVIVGEQSYGKGSVQEVFSIEVPGDVPEGQEKREAAAKITIARFFSPSGRSMSRLDGSEEYGVTPDHNVDIPREIATDFYEAWGNERIRYNTGKRPEGPSIEEVDPQLKKAVESLTEGQPVAPAAGAGKASEE